MLEEAVVKYNEREKDCRAVCGSLVPQNVRLGTAIEARVSTNNRLYCCVRQKRSKTNKKYITCKKEICEDSDHLINVSSGQQIIIYGWY